MATRATYLRLVFAGILVPLGAAASGCGAQVGTVKGQVTVDGKPIRAGTVFLSGVNTRSAAAGLIRPDGTYEIHKVPVGPATAIIHQMLSASGELPKGGGPLPGLAIDPALSGDPGKVRKKYQKYETSDLTIDVKTGTNDFDLKLTSS